MIDKLSCSNYHLLIYIYLDENQDLAVSDGIIAVLLDCIRLLNDIKVISGALALLTIIGIKG